MDRDYVIPGNDDAVRSVKLMLGVLTNAIAEVNGNEMIDFLTEEDKAKAEKKAKKQEIKEEIKEVKENAKEKKEEIKENIDVSYNFIYKTLTKEGILSPKARKKTRREFTKKKLLEEKKINYAMSNEQRVCAYGMWVYMPAHGVILTSHLTRSLSTGTCFLT